MLVGGASQGDYLALKRAADFGLNTLGGEILEGNH